MAVPSLGIPTAVLAVVVSVLLSVPANFATKVAQERWIRKKQEREEERRWYENLRELVGRIGASSELYKQSLVSHGTLVPDDEFIEKQLKVAFAQERSNFEDKLDDEILDEVEDFVMSEEARSMARADHQESAIEKIEKINQRKMSDMKTLHDELLRHVASKSMDKDEIDEPLETLLIQTYLESIFPEITDSNYKTIQDCCDQLIEACDSRIEQLS